MAKSTKSTRKPPLRGKPTGRAQTIPKPSPAVPGGPNRQARKEEARRQREVLRRKMARRRAVRIVAIVTAVVVVAGGIAAYVVLKPSAAQAAGCGPVQTIPPYNPSSQDRVHIGSQGAPKTPPPLSSYTSHPPVSGPHLPPGQTLHAGVYDAPPSVYMDLHSLEHGATTIWYAPSAGTSSALTKLTGFFQNGSPAVKDHVIVAPYRYPDQGAAGQLPAGKLMVMTAWHHTQTCRDVSLGAAQDFIKHYRIPTGGPVPNAYRGDAPEAGSAI